MNYTKRLTHTLKLLLATVFAVCASLSANADTFQDEASGLYFSTSTNGTCSVVKPTDGTTYTFENGDLVIPSTVTYNDTEYTVTGIGKQAFYKCTSLTSVDIPESITSMKEDAFYGCSGLEKIDFPNLDNWLNIKFDSSGSNPLFYARHFYLNGEELTDLVIPDNVTSIGNYTFTKALINSVTLPESLISIGKGVFYGCYKLKSVTIPKNVNSIEGDAFFLCSNLTKVETTDLEAWCKICFKGGAGSNPLYHAKHLYLNGEEVTDLVIPDGITSISQYAFYNCSSLTSVSIPESVTSIGQYAFYNCSSLTSVTIPESVTKIGTEAFSGCSGLKRVDITDLEAWLNISFKSNTSNPLYYAKHLYLNGELVTDIVIPNTLTVINDYAFYGWKSITSVTIPESITSIGKYAFANCTSLKTVNISGNGTSLGDYIFSGCASLESVILPDNISSIGNYAFNGCKALTAITWPESLTSIGTNAFQNCSALTSTTIPEGVTAINNYTFSGCSSLASVSMLGDVTSIGTYAFNGCKALTSITLPESLTSIGTNAFQNCSALASITIPGGVTNVQDYTFSGCTSLASVSILGDVTSIGSYAFNGCEALTSITLPESLTSIGTNAFQNCSALASITIPGGVTNVQDYTFSGCTSLASVTFSEGVKSIAANSFKNCTSLEAIYVPKSLTSFTADYFKTCTSLNKVDIADLEAWCKIDFAYSNYNPIYYAKHLYLNGTELTDLVIPETITVINNNAFVCCESLVTVTIPKGVTSVGQYAFSTCSNLTRVDTPDLEAWSNIDFANRYSNPLYYAQHLYINGSLLTNLVIPESITAIKDYTFEKCADLVYLDLGSNITSIGFESFFDCEALKGEYTNKFTPSEYKYVLEIPSSVITIADRAFDECSAIENLWIGTGCTSIGYQAFHCNGNLKSVTCLAYPAPALARLDVFNDVDYENAYLYIYEGDENTEYSDIYDSYADKENNYWYLFLKGISVGVDEVADEDGVTITTDGMAINVAGNEGDIEVYNITGMKVYQGNDNHIDLPNAGIYVVIVNGESYKIAIK
jgi:hypothetical protein